MAHLIWMPRAAWKRQPQGPVEPGFYWQQRQVLAAYTGVPSLNLLTRGGPSTVTNATFGCGPYGRNWVGDRGRYGASAQPYISATGRPMTVIARIQPAYANTGIDALIGFGAQQEWNKAFQVYVNVVNSGDVYVGSYGCDIGSSGGGYFSAGQSFNLAVVYTGGVISTSTVLIYINGVAVSVTGYGDFSGEIAIVSGQPIYFAMDTSGENRAFRGTIDYIIAFESALSVYEIQQVHQNPWQLFKPRPARFILIPSGGGATTHDAALTLAYIVAFDPAANAQFNAGLTLATLAGAMSGPSAQFNSALTLDTNVSITLQRALTALATVQLDMTAGQSVSALNAAVAAITESIACSYTSSVTANLLAGLSLAISQGLLSSTGATLHEALTLALNTALTPSAQASYATQLSLLTTLQTALTAALSTSATLTLPATFTVTIDGEKLGNNDLALALNVQTGISTTATAILSAQLTLATQLLATPAGVGSFQTALTLANQLSALFTTGNAITSSLSLAVSLALADAAAISLGGSLELGAVLSQVQSAIAAFQANLTLPTTLTAPITGGLTMDDGISLGWTLGTNLDGTFFEITVTLPTGRIVVITASDRLISIQVSERLIQLLPTNPFMQV